MESKRRVIDTLHSICAVRDDFRLRLVMSAFKNGLAAIAKGPPVIAPKDSNIEQMRVAELQKPGKLGLKRRPSMVAIAPLPPGVASDAPTKPTRPDRAPSLSKFLSEKMSSSLGSLLSTSIEEKEETDFHDASNFILSADFQALFDDCFETGGEIDGKALDLDAISDSPLGIICMDLMMYDSPALFEASFSLLKSMFEQRLTIIRAMRSVQLLHNEELPLFDSLSKLKSEVSELRKHVESYETWGAQNSFSPIDREIVNKVTNSLAKLSAFCFEPPNSEILASSELPGEIPKRIRRVVSQNALFEERAPVAMWQDLLRNLGVDTLLITAIDIPHHAYDSDDQRATHDVLLAVVRAAWACATSFVFSNAPNQEIFRGRVQFMVSEMRTSPGLPIAEMLTEVFRDNLEMIEQADESLFHEFATRLNASGHNASYLNFFEVMLETPKGVVKSSQRKVVQTLTDPKFEHVLMLESPIASVQLAKHLWGDFYGDGDIDKDDQLLKYYLRLMALFEVCCCEQNTFATGVVQKLISQDVMYDAVFAAVAVGDVQRKKTFSRMLLSVYFDTPLIDTRLRTNPKTWAFLEEVAKEAREFGRLEDARNHPEAASFLHGTGVPCIVKFFTNLYRPQGYPDSIRRHREALINHQFCAATDESMSMDIRRCAFMVCELLDPSRTQQLDDKTRKALARRRTISKQRAANRKTLGSQVGHEEPRPLVSWKIFSELCQTDEGLLKDTNGGYEMDGLVSLFESVEQLTDPKDPHYVERRAAGDKTALADQRHHIITFEKIARSMINHVSKNLNNEPLSGYDTVDVNTAILKIFRLVLHSRRPSQEARGQHHGGLRLEEQKRAYVLKQNQIADWGGANLIVDVLALSNNKKILQAALEFGVQILDGGNPYVQAKFYETLTTRPSGLFFATCRRFIRTAIEALEATGDIVAASESLIVDEHDEDGFLGFAQLFEFLRLWAENHNLDMQNILREQPQNRKSVNLIEDACALLFALTKDDVALHGMPDDELTDIEAIVNFLVESVQGPCVGNQDFLATMDVVDICRRLLLASIWEHGANSPCTVARVRNACCALLSALMEGPESRAVRHSLALQLDGDFFRKFIVMLHKRTEEVENYQQSTGHATKSQREELENLMRCRFNIVNVFMQLAMFDPLINEKMQPRDDESDVDYKRACSTFLMSRILRLEFVWHDAVDLTYFPECDQAVALTELAQEKLLESCDLTCPDTKKRQFLTLAQELVDEMFYNYDLSKVPLIASLQKHFLLLRQVSFTLVVLLNVLLAVTVRGTGNGGTPYHYGRKVYRFYPDSARYVYMGCGGVIIALYALCLLYLIVSRVPLARANWRRRRRLPPTDGDGVALIFHRIGDWQCLRPWLTALALYLVFGWILYYAYGSTALFDRNYLVGLVGLALWLLRLLNHFFKEADHHVAFTFCTTFTALTEQRTLALIIFTACMCAGMVRWYLCPLALLDIVTLSERLQTVLNSVIKPVDDLVRVFLLMIFVIYIFSTIGLWTFGTMFEFWDDDLSLEAHIAQNASTGDVTIEGAIEQASLVNTCPNLALCFFTVLDEGMRTGDIVSGAIDEATYQDGRTYADRMVYGIFFFLIVGVILFDIVTGVIIDTFSALRELKNERIDTMKNVAFISDIERAEYEKLGPHFKFEKLRHEDQHIWNYVLYIAHLRLKDPTLYTGPESAIAKKLESLDVSWLPDKTCWQMQIEPTSSNDVDDPTTRILKELEELKTQVAVIVAHQSRAAV